MIETLGQQLLEGAVAAGSSDLYVLPKGEGYGVFEHQNSRFQWIQDLSAEKGQQLIAHFKYRANMAITEARRPQLGSMMIAVNQVQIHLRLSTVGNFKQLESMVIRLIYPLATQQSHFLVPGQFERLQQWCQLRGLVLFAGPTGSGKTSTIYQLAKTLSHSHSVLTIEDPVEIAEPTFLQLQVNQEAQMSYNDLIKVALRHRPDVLILGEIRDVQTAQAAIDAALSGHLVLSTVHALNVHGIVPRLLQLGVDELALHQAVTGVAYQRLIPTITGAMAALLDMKRGPVNEEWREETGMTTEWRCYLGKCVENQQISESIANRFQEG
ncbi:competence type IV pilus ATPase ComGA [uncultured Secundilactobacillus sp.]|uniref:competence type IV pilus ATPase ComGA n=1 Tax=uncultured Secundilactobacillus sp. TaxID=2813935 RepID=UPI002588445C|nr:competence type IV pilus ATPase ComGA [uncultured Secundilactobacillus sp.]